MCPQVWQPPKRIFGVNSTGCIINIHKFDDNHVISITQNGIITIWSTNGPWQSINQETIDNLANMPNIHILFTCLSRNKYLAILREPYHLIIYVLYESAAMTTMPRVQLWHYYTHVLPQKATCCEISPNERYIAVGLQTGLICVSCV